MATVQQPLFVFPPTLSPDAVEWPGDPIGRSNVITRTRSRTKLHDKVIDRTPGRRDHLVNAAIAHIVQNAGREPFFLHDVVIHGIRVRAITNSQHLIEFWRQNWYDPAEWTKTTGVSAPDDPRIVVYALGGVRDESEAAYYSRATNTIIFFNTSYYGQLKSWVLGAVGRVLAADYGIHSIHGACVERGGDGILYIAPTGTGKSTSSYGLMTYSDTRFHSDDWVYVRYARVTRSGQRLVPIEIETSKSEIIRGYRCNRWLDEHPGENGFARCLDLSNNEVTIDLADFDHRYPVEAYAYTSEKIFYLRTNLVENFPDSADAIVRSDLENVPSPTPEFLRANAATVDSIVDELRSSDHPGVRQRLGTLPIEDLRALVSSLFAFDNARAMLDIGEVFEPSRVISNPMEPVRLTTVFLLKRTPSDPVVLKVLTQDQFMGRLLIGQTPDSKREIAYNAYRAVDDEAEQQLVRSLEAQAEQTGEPLYQLFERAEHVPESLREEFELFREMFRATLCYDLNTTLQRDPRITSKKEAVRLTLQLILRGVENRSRDLTLALDNYRSQIRG
jgi:hypothetical protein